MMASGHTYAMVLQAVADPALDLSKRPLVRTLTNGSADLVSGALSP